MRRFLIFALWVPTTVLAMGEQVSAPPQVRKNIAKVVDREGVSHTIKGLVCGSGGEIRFRKGSIDYRVSQASISKLTVTKRGSEDVNVKVLFEDGDSEEYMVSSSLRCTAETDRGSVDFYIDEVREITFERSER